MVARPSAKRSWFTVLLVLAVIVLWVIELKREASESHPGSTEHIDNKSRSRQPASKPQQDPPARLPAGKAETQGAYEVYRQCTLENVRGNDGDSFTVRLPDGRKVILRLYFVDTPECEFRRYAGGETNYERIRQQAADMGGITPEQAVDIGKKGKAFTLSLLAQKPFTIYTCWDSPYHDDRFHAFVEVPANGGSRWLHEQLVERGLVRIKTKPADLPDGTPASGHRDHLRALEREAKRMGTGVWGL